MKTFEARGAVLDGADEIDMVINIAAARAGDKGALVEDISAVAEAVHASGAILKVIIETVFLDDDQKVLACEAAVEAGADFVKTSTGFNGGGATAEDIALMRRDRGPGSGRQGLRRRTVPGRRAGYDCCRCNTYWCQLRHCDRQG